MADTNNEKNGPEIPALIQSENPAITPEPEKNENQNEPVKTGNDAVKGSVSEKIFRASAAVFQKAGVLFKPGRGRPKNCEQCSGQGCEECGFTGKQPNRAAKPVQPGGGSVPASQPASQTTDQARVEGGGSESVAVDAAKPLPASCSVTVNSIVGTLKGILGTAKAVVNNKMRRAGLDGDFRKRAMAELTAEEGEALTEFAGSLEVVCQKRGISLEYAPELNCISSLGRLATPYWIMIDNLNEEIERRKKEGK